MTTPGFDSPAADKPSSNLLRRSLVLRLDQARRLQCETLDGDTEEEVTEDVFLPSDSDLIQALDLDGSHHCRPQLRIRPVASYETEPYCTTCGGSTALFQTPRQRRSLVPPRQTATMTCVSVPYCQCHDTTTQSNGEPTSGARLSFVQMTNMDSRGSITENFRESLQLLLLDDDSSVEEEEEEEDDYQQSQSAFRRRIILQPKATAINRCHSDPAYISGTLSSSNVINTSQAELNTSTDSAPRLLNASSESSATNSPEDRRNCKLSQGTCTTSVGSSHVDSTALAAVTSQQEPNNNSNSRETCSNAIPLLPTMATPETIRPLFRSIALAPHPSSTDMLQHDGVRLPSPPFSEDDEF